LFYKEIVKKMPQQNKNLKWQEVFE